MLTTNNEKSKSQDGKEKIIKEKLFKEAEKANSENLIVLISTNVFDLKTLDEAIRICMRNFPKNEKDQIEHMKCLQILLEALKDFNFRNESDENTTIFMKACLMGLTKMIEYIISLTQSGFYHFEINKMDNIRENCLHKLIISPNYKEEWERVKVFKFLLENGVSYNLENIDGYTPLAYALLTGNSKISEELIKIGADTNTRIKENGDNLLHCAVRGKNPICVSVILNHSQNDLRNIKNKNSETPIECAIRMNLTKIVQLLSENQNGIETGPKILSMIPVLEEFKNENFEEVLKLLNEMKNNQKDNYISLDWNILLTEYTKEMKNKNDFSSTSSAKFSYYNNFLKFFDNFNSQNNNFRNYKHILFFNYCLLLRKMGDFKKAVRVVTEGQILKRSLNKYEWIIFVNVSFILVQIFLNLKQLKIVSLILENLELFLNETFKVEKKESDSLKPSILEYLDSREVLNKFTSQDDSFCVLTLFKSYKFLLEDKLEDSKKLLKEYKRIYTSCKFKDQHSIFNTTKNLYYYLKIKIDFHNNSFFKCYKHLNNLINPSLTKQNKFNEKISVESYIFYWNAIGILNIKQKKFNLAEFFFKKCLSVMNDKAIVNILDWKEGISNVKYNIGLCQFYQKNFAKAFRIFSSIKEDLNFNPFLFYRLGLCSLGIELNRFKAGHVNSYSNINNEIVEKLLGYTMTTSSITDSYQYSNTNGGDSTFIHSDLADDKLNLRRIILRNLSPMKDENNKILAETVSYFKQAILLLKDNIHHKKEINDVFYLYNIKDPNLINSSLNTNDYNHPETKSYSNILSSSYLNLLYCLTLKEQWTEVIFYADQFESSDYYNKDIATIIDNYKIQALLALNQHAPILEIIKRNMLSSSVDFKGNFYNKLSKTIYPELSYKLALYVNIIKMNFINNNLVEVEKGIISVISLLNVNLNIVNGVITHDDLPPFILNLLIYYFLVKENYEGAIKIIKYRKLPLQFVPSIFINSSSKSSMSLIK